jgi:hypothetical protein
MKDKGKEFKKGMCTTQNVELECQNVITYEEQIKYIESRIEFMQKTGVTPVEDSTRNLKIRYNEFLAVNFPGFSKFQIKGWP